MNQGNQSPAPRLGGPEIYLSWAGEVYGPSTVEEVMAGVRSSFFEPGAVFWFEGRSEWRPVEEFPALLDSAAEQAVEPPLSTSAPPVTATLRPVSDFIPDETPRRAKGRQPRVPGGGSDRRFGLLIVFAFIVLAVALTVGLLLLLMAV